MAGAEPVADVLLVLRNLHDAALEARSYVYAASVATVPGADSLLRVEAAAHLERLDAAMSDAGEELDGVGIARGGAR